MIVDGQLSDEDDASSNGSYLSFDSYSESAYWESSETDEDFNNATFATSQSAKVQRTIRTRGGIRHQPTSRPVVQNVTQASNARELQQQKPKRFPENKWFSDLADPPAFQFTARPGPLVDILENADPTFFLGLILTEELLQFMVERTNNYAQKILLEKTMSKRSTFKNWKPIHITEMKIFLGLLLHVGVLNLTNLQDYWSRDPFLQSNGIWKHIMSRNQFLLLLRFWHLKDETNPESRLQKISPLIDHLKNTMS